MSRGFKDRRFVVSYLYTYLIFYILNDAHKLDDTTQAIIKEAIFRVCDLNGGQLIIFEYEPHCINFIVRYPATISVSSLVNRFKSASTKALKREASGMLSVDEGVFCSASYAAYSVDPTCLKNPCEMLNARTISQL